MAIARTLVAGTALLIADAFLQEHERCNGSSAESLSLIQTKASQFVQYRGSLPPMPANFPAMEFCSKGELAAWESKDTTADFLKAWKSKRPNAAIVETDEDTACFLEGKSPSRQSNVALTLVKKPEAEICSTVRDWAAPDPKEPQDLYFYVKGTMANSDRPRRYQVIWPEGVSCDAHSKCPVLIFFHGCGRTALPYDQVVKDPQCGASLRSVIVVPWLDDKNDERWTEGAVMLEEFIIPLWEHLLQTNPGFDENQVTVAGSSLGSGMALQAGLLRPDLFSAVMAGGFADGSHCAGDDPNSVAVPYDPSKLLGGKSIPSFDAPTWKLKLIVLIMGENELGLAEKVNSMIGVLDSNGVSEKTALHLRLYGGANHPQCSINGFNQWGGLHSVFWGASTAA